MLKKRYPITFLGSLIAICVIVLGIALIAGYLAIGDKCVYKGPLAKPSSGACSGNSGTTDNTIIPATDNMVTLPDGSLKYTGSSYYSFTIPNTFTADDNGDAILIYEKGQNTAYLDRMVVKRIPYTEPAAMDLSVCTSLIASYADQNNSLGTVSSLQPGELTTVDGNLACTGSFILTATAHPNPVTEIYYTVYSESQQADYLLLILIENNQANLPVLQKVVADFKIT